MRRSRRRAELTVDERGEGVVHVNGEDLPVRLAALAMSPGCADSNRYTHVVDGKRTEDLDLLDLSNVPETTASALT